MTIKRLAHLILLLATSAGMTACKTTDHQTVQAEQQTPAFGQPESSIPWNRPQGWEGGVGGLGAMRDGRYEDY